MGYILVVEMMLTQLKEILKVYATATIAGKICNFPKSETTSGGTQVLSFPMTIPAPKDKQTIWVDCVFFGKAAEAMEGKLQKGMPVTVTGNISANVYTKNNGEASSRIRMEVGKYCIQYPQATQPQPHHQAPPPPPASHQSQQYTSNQGGHDYVNPSDIPF